MPHYVQNVHVVLGKCQICDSRHLFAVAFWTHLNHQKCDKTLAPHSYDGVRHLPPNLGQSNDTSAQVAWCSVGGACPEYGVCGVQVTIILVWSSCSNVQHYLLDDTVFPYC